MFEDDYLDTYWEDQFDTPEFADDFSMVLEYEPDGGYSGEW